MQFAVGMVRYWVMNLASWAAGIGAVSYFLGYIDEVPAFFRANQAMMIGAMLLHFALCAIIYHASDTKRLAKRVANVLGGQ